MSSPPPLYTSSDRCLFLSQRHATATRSDVGIPKVTSCATFFQEIAPWIVIEPLAEQFTLEDAPRLLDGRPDFVVDCIDNITTKVDLLAYCHRNNIRVRRTPVLSSISHGMLIMVTPFVQVISALGAASKADPSRIQLADISETLEDPLARAVRRRLWVPFLPNSFFAVRSADGENGSHRRLEGVASGIPVVYSTELVRLPLFHSRTFPNIALPRSLQRTSDCYPSPKKSSRRAK